MKCTKAALILDELYPGLKQDLHTAAFWLSRAAHNGRPAARHLYCAVVRRAFPARQLGLLHCFDETTDGPSGTELR